MFDSKQVKLFALLWLFQPFFLGVSCGFFLSGITPCLSQKNPYLMRARGVDKATRSRAKG
jgi:hypothetical protein